MRAGRVVAAATLTEPLEIAAPDHPGGDCQPESIAAIVRAADFANERAERNERADNAFGDPPFVDADAIATIFANPQESMKEIERMYLRRTDANRYQ